MPDEIKAGDVVQLKSGGPKMTVDEVGVNNGVMKAWCVWFKDDKKDHGTFPISSLKHAD
jgi:uncharacterized protein YodC (DUF2158 family)